jgi:hypothetical protein
MRSMYCETHGKDTVTAVHVFIDNFVPGPIRIIIFKKGNHTQLQNIKSLIQLCREREKTAKG